MTAHVLCVFSTTLCILLNMQFIHTALLNGELNQDKYGKKGTIHLPLAPDYINRPMQMVSDKGKPAQTIYEVGDFVDGRTRVHFYPVTVSKSCTCQRECLVLFCYLTIKYALSNQRGGHISSGK